MKEIKTSCSKCNNELDKNRVGKYRYCKECHNKYARENRKGYNISDEQKQKINTRAITQVNIQRGRILRDVCYLCGSEKSQAHHNDYTKPLEVVWLCRECHLKAHSDDNIMEVIKNAPIAKLRSPKGIKSKCSKCGKEKEVSRGKQRYCKSCHAESMRKLRAKING